MLKQTFVIADPLSAGDIEEEAKLFADERWVVVQRILLSAGFQRAGQLRKILLHITRAAILNPETPLREYEIACEVLGRRADFDPISDNIVRAQMSHLRRKLETFYLEEGHAETIRVTIPKGSYQPAFSRAGNLPHAPVAPVTDQAEPESASATHPAPVGAPQVARWGWLQTALGAGCLIFAIATGVLAWRLMQNTASKPPAAPAGNAFVSFLSKSSGSVAVVLPDTSLSLLQQNFRTSISAEDYANNQYLQKEMSTVTDPQFNEFLTQLRKKRNTSMGEAIAASEFQRIFTLSGTPMTLRFARDLHSRDLNEGNTIIIGSRKSNPWAWLFNQRMNFVFLQDPADRSDYFENRQPQAGEQPRYVPFQHHDGKVSSYIDVALTPNLTSSGYVLLFNGSDSQSVEAASHFLMYGKLPVAIDSMLRHDNLNYFEIFLRGTHAGFESEETFEVVAVRSASIK